MKKILKNFIYIFTIFTIIFICPTEIKALTNSSDYATINESTELEVGNLKIYALTFHNYANTSTKAFGLTGSIYNSSSQDINFNATAYYYDKDFYLVGTTYYNQSVPAGKYNSYNHMSNLTELDSDYSADDIYYYKLVIETTDLEENNVTAIIPSEEDDYSSYDYVIDSYDIDIVVNENNTFDITENITAYFNVSKHGIYRTIPLKNTITRLDGSTSKNRAKVTNVDVDHEFTTSRVNGNYKIKIGSQDITLIGEQKYTISYNYNIGKDTSKDYDEFYYNIIGNEWDTVISNVTFKITMPKEFDASTLGFSKGLKGSTDNSNIQYNVDGNVITGSYNGVLNPNEALTIRMQLEEGYFVGAGFGTDFTKYLLFIIPLVCVGISLILWYKFGKDNMVVETVEFYPPEGFNSLEIGYLYKGKADNEDVVSLLVYLANKGYIQIKETEEKSLFSKSKGFKIRKLKEYDGDNVNERLFLNGLFTKKPSISKIISSFKEPNEQNENINNELNEVTSLDLYDNFYITMNRILANINNKENKNKIFEKNTLGKSIVIILMIFISLFTIMGLPTLEYGGISEVGTTLFLTLFYIPFYAVMFAKKIPTLFRLFWGGFTIFHSLMFFITLPITEAIIDNKIYLFGFLFGIACIAGMIFLFKVMPKRTSYGNEILGRIKGFKNFLETAEKEKLEAMVMENPTYFYDILPYTYVLGISDKWIEKFETIGLQSPDWYCSNNGFNISTFGTFMNTTMKSATKTMSSSPSSSSSGGSSGGGSSGGGSGGGGGGSW